MAEEQVVISVADDQVADMSSVVDALRQAGLRVTEVLDSVPGVAEVERSREFQLPDEPTH